MTLPTARHSNAPLTAKTMFIGAAAALWLASTPPTAVAAGSASVASKAATAEERSRFEQETARCTEGRSNQDRETCLREARNALADAKRGQLAVPGADLGANAQSRCAPLPADQRGDCLRRAEGQGTVSGSVQSGGIYRETTTIVPPPGTAASGTPARAAGASAAIPGAARPAPAASASN